MSNPYPVEYRRVNVTEKGLREYIEVLHSTLYETTEQYIPTELRDSVFHLSLLPARIIGYVSTQYGVAVEWQPADQTEIEIVRGSARVEDLLVQAPASRRNMGPLILISRGNGIAHISLEDAFPFRLRSTESSAFLDNVRFKAGLWTRAVDYAEVYGDRAAENWSREKAVSTAKDEVLAALSELRITTAKNVSVAEYISTFKEKMVFLLGDYDAEGLERLRRISFTLRQLGYEPLLVKDVPDIPAYDLTQKVVAIGAIARFVVIDDSSKSGHLAEVEICRRNDWVTILLRAGGRGGSWMTAGASHLSSVVLEKDYAASAPEAAIGEAAEWAEAKLDELQRSFDSTYPWRNVDRQGQSNKHNE